MRRLPLRVLHLCLRILGHRIIDRIVLQNVAPDGQIPLPLLEIRYLVSIDFLPKNIERLFVLRRALVAAVGRQMCLFLAPHIEIHSLKLVIRACLRTGVAISRSKEQKRAKREAPSCSEICKPDFIHGDLSERCADVSQTGKA